ncbi:MAG: hypothetical protein NVSMB64_27930 [Candidatus Velthaea sp.]
MRRLVLSLLAASSVALLTACGPGGSAFNLSDNNKLDRIILSTAGQPPGVFKVVPGGSIAISATGVKGSQNSIVTGDTNFTFNVGPAPAGALYQGGIGAADGIQGVCLGFSQLVPPVAPSTTPTTVSLVPTITQNSLAAGAATDSVIFTAPTIASLNVPLGPNTAAPAPAAYCVIINATHTSDGVVGSATVYVGN